MQRDSVAGLIEPMLNGCGSLFSRTDQRDRTIDPQCLENRCSEGAEPTLTESVAPSISG